MVFLEKHSKKTKKEKTVESGIKKSKQVLADYDPTGPITVSGSLFSFRDLKPMPIPEKDLVSIYYIALRYKQVNYFIIMNIVICLYLIAWKMSFCRRV